MLKFLQSYLSFEHNIIQLDFIRVFLCPCEYFQKFIVSHLGGLQWIVLEDFGHSLGSVLCWRSEYLPPGRHLQLSISFYYTPHIVRELYSINI